MFSALLGSVLLLLAAAPATPVQPAARAVWPAARAPAAETPIDVRVGIVAFQDFHQERDRYERLFSDLSGSSQRPIHFRLATGTYGDVLHWIDRELIDVAVLTPGVFAETLKDNHCEYLATVGQQSESVYQAVCVVAERSSLKSVDHLRRAARAAGWTGSADAGRVQFLFVHPLSVSGRIAPEFALREVGIDPAQAQVEYTYSHSNSLRLLSEQSGDRERVAFVWDGALGGAPGQAAIRRLAFPALEKLSIPQDVVVARRGYKHAKLVRSLLADHVDAQGDRDFVQLDDWKDRYGMVQRWADALKLPADAPEAQTVSLDEIGQLLLHYARSQPDDPRLALVLSGGGAKCAYQVGAVAALEEMLATLRRDNPEEQGLDIALVVGTSGGAMNALPMALGVSATPEGQQDFREVWRELDQREIIRPSWLVRGNIGLWFAFFQTALVLLAVTRFISRPQRAGWVAASVFVVLGATEIMLGYLPGTPWSWLGTGHLLHHAWLWCTFGVRWSAWCLLGLGLTGFVAQRLLLRRGKHLVAPRRLVIWVLAVGLLGLPMTQVLTVLFHEKTLSSGTGIEHVLADKFARLIDGELDRRGLPSLSLGPSAGDAERLRAMSDEIIKRDLLKRDLVVTGSCLSRTTAELPSDLYFYAASDPTRQVPDYADHGVSLAHYPTILLDAVMGSGAIFPLFPARTLDDFPQPGQQVELVDGGFAHNSPIEAAVRWGATHIVLIKASPEQRVGRRSFLENVAGAFSHLFAQAQLADIRSKEQVVIFTLNPELPHICVLDFADNLIDAVIDKGYREARGKGQQGWALFDQPRFRKELGEPVFTDSLAP